MRAERGFALLSVLLVLGLLGVVMAEFAYSARLEAGMVRAWKDGVLAAHLAEAGVQQAIREILVGAPVQAVDEDGRLVFYRTDPLRPVPVRVPPLPREKVALGAGAFTYRLTDEESRLNVNLAAPDRLAQLLLALDVQRGERDTIVDSIQDWKDPNDLHRPAGAESEDHYLKLPVPYRARNAALTDVHELLQIKGVTPELFRGTRDRPGLAQVVTVWGRNVININTAPPAVLKAIGLSDAEIGDIVQTRVRAPYGSVPGRFAGRGLTVGGQVFRIEAEGLVAGEPRARIVAVVQRVTRAAPAVLLPGATAPAAPPVAILSWRAGDDA